MTKASHPFFQGNLMRSAFNEVSVHLHVSTRILARLLAPVWLARCITVPYGTIAPVARWTRGRVFFSRS